MAVKASRRALRAHGIVREIHFFCAAILAASTLFYAISGMVMGWDKYLPAWERVDETEIQLESPAPNELSSAEQRPWAMQIGAQLGLGGKLANVKRRPNGTWRLVFKRPGTELQLTLRAGGTAGNLETKVSGPVETANRFHQLHGYRGPLEFQVWAFAADVVAVGMLVFVGTGIFLWWVTWRDMLPAPI